MEAAASADPPPWAADVLAALPLFLTVAKTAEVLLVSPKTVRRRVHEKALAAHSSGRRMLIARKSLVEFLARSA